MTVQRDATVSVPLAVVIAPGEPGIFTTNQQGTGQGIVVDSSSSQIADSNNPVQRGRIVTTAPGSET
jgi:uncharacterized protein (TIGR03437 family)